MYEFYNNNKLNTIDITLSIGCKLDCYYCPQKKLLNAYFANNKKRQVSMSMKEFKTIISKVKLGGTISFSGMCEPFHNPECADMILYAHNHGYRICLNTTLVGITEECMEKLKDIKFEYLTLHIPDKEGNSKFDITDDYLNILEKFHQKFDISNYSCHGTIHPQIEPYINKNLICSSNMMDRAGNLDHGWKQTIPNEEIICVTGSIGGYGNWTPEVLPDGTVLLCCMDYSMDNVLGNLLTMSVEEILNGSVYKKIQKGMKDESIDILCRKCPAALPYKKTPAYILNNKLNNLKQGNLDELNDCQIKILELFLNADNICVFGLGKLFWDNFFTHRWNDFLGHKYYCDNNPELWGKVFNGVECLSPNTLDNLSKVLVITCMSNDTDVRKQLAEKGITNVINIMNLYKNFGYSSIVTTLT